MIEPRTSRSNLVQAGAALVLLSVVAACGFAGDGLLAAGPAGSPEDAGAEGGSSGSGGGSGGGSSGGSSGERGDGSSTPDGSSSTPTVVTVLPVSGGVGVARNATARVTFSEAMNGASISGATFTLTQGATPVAGTVTYASGMAVFAPTTLLDESTRFTATITSGALSAHGVALAAPHSWSFTTGSRVAPALPIDLGTSGSYVILTKAGISTVPTSAITGNIGVSPAAAGSVTGFPLVPDATNLFSLTPQVTGKVYAADYAMPTPTNLTAAISDMETAFTNGAARTADVTELGAGELGGLTLGPGVYSWSSGVLVSTDVTLSGDANDVFIFQIAQTLLMSTGTKVVLAGAVRPKNVYWQVAGLVSLNTGAHLEGVVLAQTAVTLGTGTSINGRLLAQTAVTLAGSTIVQPAP